jgi:hypothetical protein
MTCFYSPINLEFSCPIREEAHIKGRGTAHQRESIILTEISPGTNLEKGNFHCEGYMPSVCQDGCIHGNYCPSFRVLTRFVKRTKPTTGYWDFTHAVKNIHLERYKAEIKRMEREWWKQTVEAVRAAEKSLKQSYEALMQMQQRAVRFNY